MKLSRSAMLKHDLFTGDVSVCLILCPSHAGDASKLNGWRIVVPPAVSPGTLIFWYQILYPRSQGNQLVRASNETAVVTAKNANFLPTNRYVGNDKRHGIIITMEVTWTFEWYQFRCSWMTSKDRNATANAIFMRLKNGPLRIWHNFTNSEHLLIILGKIFRC